jgi:hypothetical protein
MSSPQSCPRWRSCSAPICPLDTDWRLRKHLQSEPTCGLLLELAKPGGEATLRACLPAKVAEGAISVAAEVMAAHGPIRRACGRASRSGSKLRQFQAIRESQATEAA